MSDLRVDVMVTALRVVSEKIDSGCPHEAKAVVDWMLESLPDAPNEMETLDGAKHAAKAARIYPERSKRRA